MITRNEVLGVPAAPLNLNEVSADEPKPSNATQSKKPSGDIKQWYRWASEYFHLQRLFESLSDLTSKQKMLLRVGIVAGVFLLCATIAILPVLFLIILHSSRKYLVNAFEGEGEGGVWM
jgi:hypothetical protein